MNKARHRQRRSEDQRPTVQVTTADSRQLAFENIQDVQGRFPWRGEGVQPKWSIEISQNQKAKTLARRFPAKLRFVDRQGTERTEPMGYLTEDSGQRFRLEERFKTNRALTITGPDLTTQVPWARQNDATLLYEQRARYLSQLLAPPAGKDPQAHATEMAIALWRQSKGGRKLVMQEYPEAIADRLRNVP